jgi:PilZ domain-containing protein
MVALLKMPNRITSSDGAERRNFPRKESSSAIEGRRVDHSLIARQQPRLALQLRDLSFGGLSAISQTPLMRGERVAVAFPRQGLVGGWDALGRVIRCEPSATGYRIAMEFDMLPAA